MKLSESDHTLEIEDIWWGMIALLWLAILLPLLLLLRYGIADLPYKFAILPLLLLATALLLYTAVQITLKSRWRFDFATETLTWSQKGPFIRRSGSLPFSDIQRLFIQADSGIAPDSRRYRLAITASDDVLPFTPYFLRDDKAYYALHHSAERIGNRLGLKINDDDTIRDLLERNMESSAIRQARIIHKLSAAAAKVHVEGLGH